MQDPLSSTSNANNASTSDADTHDADASDATRNALPHSSQTQSKTPLQRLKERQGRSSQQPRRQRETARSQRRQNSRRRQPGHAQTDAFQRQQTGQLKKIKQRQSAEDETRETQLGNPERKREPFFHAPRFHVQIFNCASPAKTGALNWP